MLWGGVAVAGGGEAREARFLALAEELRCLVCQNQSLADSNAELAGDMRAVLRRKIAEGESDEEIVAFMRARYGEFVSYRPPLRVGTLILWGLPFVVVGGGGVALWVGWRRRRLGGEGGGGRGLSAEEEGRVRGLLGEE